MNQRQRHRIITKAELLPCSLGLSAPVMLGGDHHLTEAVLFSAPSLVCGSLLISHKAMERTSEFLIVHLYH